ncbi:hypothetical protein BDN70DRAFT_895438 [Pholiota conissans]|uniref:Uncharacterized protein n=1 Tax=Pholiota conissans TaxID=109636 RepID=A0A9P5Z1Z4_9AGAR|nr:hypothetical protein BDN70DRAFT_895438 [Pholiota conissans]
MRNFYVVLPALSMLNMGVNGATISNTLTSRSDSRSQSNGLYKGMHFHQSRQIHSADFSTGPEADVGEVAQVQPPSADHPPASSPDVPGGPVPVLEPATTFRRRLDGAPHDMDRHTRRRPEILGPLLNEKLAEGAKDAAVAGIDLAAKEVSNKSVAGEGIDALEKAGMLEPSVLKTLDIRRRHSAFETIQRDGHCDRGETFGDFVEGSRFDSAPFAVSGSMHELRQTPSLGQDPTADIFRRNSEYSTAPNSGKVEQEFPILKAILKNRSTAVSLPKVPVGASFSSLPIPAVEGTVARRTPEVTITKFTTLEPRTNVEVGRTDSTGHVVRALDAASRMVKVKLSRQEEVEAVDSTATAVSDDVALAKMAAEFGDADSFDDLD